MLSYPTLGSTAAPNHQSYRLNPPLPHDNQAGRRAREKAREAALRAQAEEEKRIERDRRNAEDKVQA